MLLCLVLRIMMLKRVFAEFIGTLIFTFGTTTSKGDPFSYAGSYIVAAACTGMISGAHFNPAITNAVFLSKYLKNRLSKEEIFELLLYVAAQFAGALIGACLSWITKGYTWKMEVGQNNTMGEAFLSETVITFTLTTSWLMAESYGDNRIIGLGVVAAAILAGDHSVGYVSGSCFNPAIGFAANFTDAVANGVSRLRYYWIYLIAPSVGSVLAVPVSHVWMMESQDQSEKGSFKQVEVEI
mmetsp:Transcript_33035/g.58190  ORF Transcript_33035/g.58190 Transcript_33035/m.58190 type:complete len:240 (-) Transcript_33035:1176-1895(-)